MMSEKDCFTLSCIMLFEKMVAIAACLDSSAEKIKHKSSGSNLFLQRLMRKWSIPMREKVKHFPERQLIKNVKERPWLSNLFHFLRKVQFLLEQVTVKRYGLSKDVVSDISFGSRSFVAINYH